MNLSLHNEKFESLFSMVESLSSVFIVLMALLMIGAVLFMFGRTIYLIFDLLIRGPYDYIRHNINPTEIEQILKNNCNYYKNLSINNKTRFISRVKKFINSKEFIGRENLQITNEMEVLISASAIQITFGLEEFMLSHFSKIFVYPKAYYSRLTGKSHVGDINIGGAIAFSWEDFLIGYAKQNDNYNVGLHEMAHALRFSRINNEEYDRFFVNYYDKWISIAMDEFNRINRNETSYLRKYAGTNTDEFFAVCTEYFFESPKELREKIPELYKHMCILLNQNPLEDASTESVRHKLLPRSIINFDNQTLLLKTKISSTIVFFSLVHIIILVLFILSYVDSRSGSSDLLNYVPVIATLGIIFYLSMIRVIYVYPNGIIIKHLFHLFTKPKYLSYEDVIGVTFNSNKISDLITMRYIENEKIQDITFPYSLQEGELIPFANTFRQNKVSVQGILVNTSSDEQHK